MLAAAALACINGPGMSVLGFRCLKDLLIGADPLDPERLWHQLYIGTSYYGRRGVALHCISAIDNCLSVADDHDVQVMIHTDTLNESGFVEDTIKAFKGRTIHAFHTEGAGGGHAPDIIKVAGLKNVLPSSTNVGNPCTSWPARVRVNEGSIVPNVQVVWLVAETPDSSATCRMARSNDGRRGCLSDSRSLPTPTRRWPAPSTRRWNWKRCRPCSCRWGSGPRGF